MEKFNAKIIIVGGAIGITIPSRVAKFGGYSVGDEIMVLTKKLEEKKKV